jgi:hypothetical protein
VLLRRSEGQHRPFQAHLVHPGRRQRHRLLLQEPGVNFIAIMGKGKDLVQHVFNNILKGSTTSFC